VGPLRVRLDDRDARGARRGRPRRSTAGQRAPDGGSDRNAPARLKPMRDSSSILVRDGREGAAAEAGRSIVDLFRGGRDGGERLTRGFDPRLSGANLAPALARQRFVLVLVPGAPALVALQVRPEAVAACIGSTRRIGLRQAWALRVACAVRGRRRACTVYRISPDRVGGAHPGEPRSRDGACARRRTRAGRSTAGSLESPAPRRLRRWTP